MPVFQAHDLPHLFQQFKPGIWNDEIVAGIGRRAL